MLYNVNMAKYEKMYLTNLESIAKSLGEIIFIWNSNPFLTFENKQYIINSCLLGDYKQSNIGERLKLYL